jgi:hypothetical protein
MRPRQDLSLNTVKRYARAKQPERLQRARSTGRRSSTLTATTCANTAPEDPAAPVRRHQLGKQKLKEHPPAG